jgi:hypothetical protein
MKIKQYKYFYTVILKDTINFQRTGFWKQIVKQALSGLQKQRTKYVLRFNPKGITLIKNMANGKWFY